MACLILAIAVDSGWTGKPEVQLLFAVASPEPRIWKYGPAAGRFARYDKGCHSVPERLRELPWRALRDRAKSVCKMPSDFELAAYNTQRRAAMQNFARTLLLGSGPLRGFTVVLALKAALRSS